MSTEKGDTNTSPQSKPVVVSETYDGIMTGQFRQATESSATAIAARAGFSGHKVFSSQAEHNLALERQEYQSD